ncbi:MAG: glutathione metabolism protein [Leptolyngbya sp. SIO4C1]|nr:glutathione metabolism protein [Leptolyngbya sp. SIO4C1]
MLITPAYAAIFGLLFVLLSVRTIRLRQQLQVAIGHGGQPQLERAARVHANFAEYVPIALLLIYLLESQTIGQLWIHGLCWVLLIGRMVHAYGVSQVKEDGRFRTAGMAMTFTVLILASAGILWGYIKFPL